MFYRQINRFSLVPVYLVVYEPFQVLDRALTECVVPSHACFTQFFALHYVRIIIHKTIYTLKTYHNKYVLYYRVEKMTDQMLNGFEEPNGHVVIIGLNGREAKKASQEMS